MTSPLRRIAHLDMDAFFASVTLLRYPQLRGLPVVIGGARALPPGPDALPDADRPLASFARLADYRGRGVITTATYEARAFGVGSAMGLMKAARLCPQAILLPADFEAYRAASRAFKAAVREIAPCIEDRGIDEIYIDFTEVPGGQRAGGAALARLIQRAVRDATGLGCSIGVAPNKLLAKMASEFDKPGGITVLHEADIADRIWPLPVRKIHGVGPRTSERLAVLGIHTIAELAAQPPQALIAAFGRSQGAWLHAAAWGRDDRPVVTSSEPVGMSRETTFERDLLATRDRAELGAILSSLCQRLAGDLQAKGYAARTIGVKLRYGDFSVVTRDLTGSAPTADAAQIRRLAVQCLKRTDLSRPLRLLGVKAGKLSSGQAPDPAMGAQGPCHRPE